VILIGTGLFWGYSIQRVHPMGARDFRLIRDKWGWHVLVALFLSGLGLIYTQLYEFFMRGHWLVIGYGGSIPLLISIFTVVMAEELFFNGYLLTRLRLFSSSIWLRAFIVVVMLAWYKVAIHMWEGLPLTYYIELFIGEAFQSYVMSWWADRTGSLVAPFLTHLIWDLLVYGSRTSIPYWVF
jgi:membrane protease YdiL (CAAX protease family)